MSERGIALVVSLLMMLVLGLLGFGLLVTSRGAIQVETSLKAQTVAFETADAGIDYARERIRICINGTGASPCNTPRTLTQLLGTARNGSTLVNSSSLANFPATTGTANGTSNQPFVPSAALDAGAFQVFMTNDRGDAVTSPTDTNNRVTLTSFGSGPNGVGFAALQAEVELPLVGLPGLPTTLILPGPTISFNGNNSNAYHMTNSSPNCASTIGVTSAASVTVVTTNLASRLGNYSTCRPGGGRDLSGAASIKNFIANDPLSPTNPYEPTLPNDPAPLPAASPRLTRVDYQTSLVDYIRHQADYTSPGDVGFTLGTAAAPKVVVLGGDYTMGPSGGAGILVVTGNLTIDGRADYAGLVFAIGQGHVTVSGNGNGSLTGAMMVANTATPWPTDPQYVGTPFFDGNGGGNAAWGFNWASTGGDPVKDFLAPVRISFQQLR